MIYSRLIVYYYSVVYFVDVPMQFYKIDELGRNRTTARTRCT